MNADVAPKQHEWDDIDGLIDNWAAWSRTGLHLGHCASFEHRYRPPQHWWPEAPRTAVDVLKAIAVERAMRQVPRQHQQALIWHYVGRAYYRWICRRLAIQYGDWDRFLSDSRLMLHNILLWQRKGRIFPPTIRHQHPAETLAPIGA